MISQITSVWGGHLHHISLPIYKRGGSSAPSREKKKRKGKKKNDNDGV